ncbi:pseudouridine synthase [Akkermansiaceae bacterium]|nr:pseudouridine synthase [Akkermansiaceae bacterium]
MDSLLTPSSPDPGTYLNILWEDQDLMVIHKSAGMHSVQGSTVEKIDSVQFRVQLRYREAMMAHRLDRSTSGIIIAALNKPCLSGLHRQFEKRTVEKNYIAVVDGIMAEDTGEIELPICCDWPNRPRQMVCYETGKASMTRYRVLERNIAENTTRVLLMPVTGRTHQLRVHMNELNHPILGCNFYKNEGSEGRASRLLLHASMIKFQHPMTGETLTIECPPEF